MAHNVIGAVVGGDAKLFEAGTVGDLRKKMGLPSNYTALVNGETATDATELEDRDQVDFAQPSKSGC